MVKGLLRILAIAGLSSSVACTVHQTEPPQLTGPSTYARSVTMTAIPDRITQDGASQSSVQVQVIGPDGRPMSGVPLRMDILAGGAPVDFGFLSPRTIVTGSDGTARTVYTAPPPSPGPNTPFLTVSIRAIPIGNDAQTALDDFVATHVDIRLMPQGVIRPPADTPTAQFSFSTPVNVNVPTSFDGSKSCPGPADPTTGRCLPSTSASIQAFSWNFGDGTPPSTGSTVQHTFTSGGSFSVTLTVTNDRGVAASTTQTVTTTLTQPPTGDWVFSPVNPVVGDLIFFNADSVKPAPGRRLIEYNWNFGDNTPGQSGFQTTHKFAAAGAYNVVLTVRDDADQKATIAKVVTIGTGNPVVVITFSPGAPKLVGGSATVNFDSSGSTMSGGATAAAYLWSFGDTGTSTAANPSHAYTSSGTFTVRLTITDSQNRSGTATVTVTVSP